MNIVGLSINYATKIAIIISYSNVWYGIGRLFIVRKCFKEIDYKINKLIYSNMPDFKAKE